MPVYKIIKLKDMSPLHVGTGKENYDFSSEELQSDTLSSALAALRAAAGKDKDIGQFLRSFALSSAFPYYKQDYFLPAYLGRLPIEVKGQAESQYRKKLKKIRFIALPLWKRLVNGETLSVTSGQINGQYLLEEGKTLPALYKRATLQRVQVPRNGNVRGNKLFYFEWTYFNPCGGLYCLIDADEATFAELKHLFKRLGEEGLGTDRTVGGGRFDVEDTGETLELPDVSRPDARMLLSLYIPSEEELHGLHLQDSRYDLLLRGGYMAGSSEPGYRHLWKKNVYMFNTGSVFATTETLQGVVVNLRPDYGGNDMHDVYRSGRTLSVPIRLKHE